jgi:hypothetical protein
MSRLSASFVSLCLLVSACGSDAGLDGEGDPSEGGGSSNGSAGASAGGGSAVAGGGSSNGSAGASAGSSASAGSGSEVAGADSGGASTGGGSNGGASNAGASNGGASSGGSAGAAGGGPTSKPIDYSIWVLQLPTGSGNSPTTISSKGLLDGYQSAYFYPSASSGGQVFMSPQTGITTSGSQHCRTEMRESVAGGGQAAWASTGTNTLTVEGKVTKVGGGTSGTVAVGQVFIGTDSIPLFELMYSNGAGGFKGLYEEAKGGGTVYDLKTKVALNERYTYTLELTKGQLTVSVNGKQVYTRTPSAATLAKKFYFKFGNYDQTATAGAISTTPYTVVEVYKAEVVHK